MTTQEIEKMMKPYEGLQDFALTANPDCEISVYEAIKHDFTTLTTKHQAELEKAVGLLKIARCPDNNCDNSGTGVDGYGEPYQCQWCYERLQFITHTKTDKQTEV